MKGGALDTLRSGDAGGCAPGDLACSSSRVAAAPCRLNLPVIERSLREVQRHFAVLSERFCEPRDPLVDHVRDNLLAGYALIDDYVARGVDLFSLNNVGLLLELNATVLCGNDPAKRAEYVAHIAATEARFFSNDEGCVKDLLEWYGVHCDESIWKRAAGVYIRILSKPQLFIEGNHRSGSLIVSYLLMREGFPPFVLSVDNAEGYFNPSTLIRNLSKRGIDVLFKVPGIRKRYACFLEQQVRSLEDRSLAVQSRPEYRCFKP